MQIEACPCCGYKTIDERGNYDICKVCWWEDDGLDNKHSTMASGPNNSINLAQARYNYLTCGLYNPRRTDLIKLKKDESQYVRGRLFEIVDDKWLIETGTNWQVNITDLIKANDQ